MPKDVSSLKKSPEGRINRRQGHDLLRRRESLEGREPVPSTSSINTHQSGDRSFFHSARNVNIDGGEFSVMGHHANLTINVHQSGFESTSGRREPEHDVDIDIPDAVRATRNETGTSQEQSELPDQKSSNIYYRHLAVKKRGYPLWIPDPNCNLPIEYQKQGISIGDVGIITPSGSFDYLFNICVPRDHPMNLGRVPPDFVPLFPPLDPTDIRGHLELKSDSYIASASIKRSLAGGDDPGSTFEISASEGAILTIPNGALSEDLGNISGVRKYLGFNVESWYRFVNGPRGREAENGDVRLVIGCDKATAWGMAAFSNVSKEEDLRLKFKPMGRDSSIQTYCWEYSGTAEVRSGPDAREIRALNSGESGSEEPRAYENQCLFVRTLNATLSDKIWNKLSQELGTMSVNNDSDAVLEPKPSGSLYSTFNSLSVNGQQSHDLQSSGSSIQSRFQYRTDAQSSSNLNDDVTVFRPDISTCLAEHPSNYINNSLLQQYADAKVVITEDCNWTSMVNEEDVVLPAPEQILKRVLAHYRPICGDDGVVFLEPVVPRIMIHMQDLQTEDVNITDSIASPRSPILIDRDPSQDTQKAPINSLTPQHFGSPATEPIRRPKRGKGEQPHFDAVHDKYHIAGRMLKYSGQVRLASTYSSTHREHRPLTIRPVVDSPYAKHGSLFARLELLEALICFTYATWNKEYKRRACDKATWNTVQVFLKWCKDRWAEERYDSEAERALFGTIWMIETYIHARIMLYTVKGKITPEVKKMYANTSCNIEKAAASVSANDAPNSTVEGSVTPSSAINSQSTVVHTIVSPSKEVTQRPKPQSHKSLPMLPTPVSTHFTPIPKKDRVVNEIGSKTLSAQAKNLEALNKKLDTKSVSPSPSLSTTHTASDDDFKRPSKLGSPLKHATTIPFKLLPQNLRATPVAPHIMSVMASVTEPMGPALVQNINDFTSSYSKAALSGETAHKILNLPILRRCFPKTWTRMMFTTLLPTEEHEPDFDDDEGELYWPEQCFNGEGIGWVCLMGKAMVNEFGIPFGYKGLAGILPKPDIT